MYQNQMPQTQRNAYYAQPQPQQMQQQKNNKKIKKKRQSLSYSDASSTGSYSSDGSSYSESESGSDTETWAATESGYTPSSVDTPSATNNKFLSSQNPYQAMHPSVNFINKSMQLTASNTPETPDPESMLGAQLQATNQNVFAAPINTFSHQASVSMNGYSFSKKKIPKKIFPKKVKKKKKKKKKKS